MNAILAPRLIRRWGWFLIISGILAQGSLIFVKRDALAHSPFEEDTFFHMAVTRNMAMGKGITIDGVERTSGAQPGNFIYVLAHIAARFDKWQALRWARCLDVLTSIGGAWCLHLIVKRMLRSETGARASAYGVLTAGLWLSSFQVFRLNLNGYETGLAAFLLLGCIVAHLRIWQMRPDGFWNDVALGAVLGLSILTRVDHGFLAASAALCYWWLAPEHFRQRCVRLATWTLVAAVVTTPWWVFNYKVGGSIMPISGKASAFQMTFHGYWPSVKLCFLRTVESILNIITLSFYSPYSWGERTAWILLLLILAICVVGYFYRAKPAATLGIAPIDLRPLAFLALFALILILYYIFMHGSWWFMKRYTHPIRAAAYIFSGLFVAGLSVGLGKKTKLKPELLFSGILSAHLLITIVSLLFLYNRTDSNQFMKVAVYLHEHCQGGKVGAFQSGTLGYFLDNIVNLDGKNNAHALAAVTNKKVIDYMLSQDLKYVADWPQQIANYCDYNEFLKYYEPIAKLDAHMVYRRRSFIVCSEQNNVFSR